ncbi:MAG: outer membrane beta-barrel protein, partial [Chitinophagaceae bacterium]
MKRILFAAAVLISLTIPASAQFRIGFTAGVQRSTVPGNVNPGWDNYAYQFSQRDGQRFGLIGDWHLSSKSKFFLQPGLFYSMKGRNLSWQLEEGGSSITRIEGQQYLNYIDVPLNLALKLHLGNRTKVFFFAGPYLSYLYSGKERRVLYFDNGQTQTFENNKLNSESSTVAYNTLDYGMNGGFGYEVGRVIFSGHFSQGMKNFINESNILANSHHRTLGASIGFYFNRSKKAPEAPAVAAPAAVAPVAASKSGRDRDKDGVPDREDRCPSLPGTAATKGCPDADVDGVADAEDACPSAAGPVRYKGCPIPDADLDGVNDELDQCPSVPGAATYNGCPVPDTDKDGVNDEADKCPAVAGVVSYNGCPVPDTDKDGVNDEVDLCPALSGVADNQGCPALNKAYVKKATDIAKKLKFDEATLKLSDNSKKMLDEIAGILNKNPELKLFIEGHTSSDGIVKNHQVLSQVR